MKKINPYDIDPNKVPLSKKITDEKEILKYKLSAEINKVIRKMTTEEVVEKTGLNRADISRLKIQSVKRFSIDRLIKISILLGQTVSLSVRPKKVTS